MWGATTPAAISIAQKISFGGRREPGQRRGAGQAVIAQRGEWVCYRAPESEGAEYLPVCMPGFLLTLVRREAPSAVSTITQGRKSCTI